MGTNERNINYRRRGRCNSPPNFENPPFGVIQQITKNQDYNFISCNDNKEHEKICDTSNKM